MFPVATHEEGEAYTKGHRCGECGAFMSVAWGGFFGYDSYIVRCPDNPKHEGLMYTPSGVEEYKRGRHMPAHTENKIEEKVGRRSMSTQLVKLTEQDRKTAIATIEKQGKFSSAAEQERALALVQAGFDPRFHLQLYQGRVITTIDALYWWLEQSPQKINIITEPIVDPDTRAAYGIGDDEIGVIAKAYRVGESTPYATGFGRASKNSSKPVIRGSAVEAQHTYRMAEKRAEAQVIRKVRPIGVDVQTREEAQTEQPYDYEVKGRTVTQDVNTETGEITEPSAPEWDSLPSEGDKHDAAKAAKTDAPLKNIGDLLNWASTTYGLSKKDAMGILGYGDVSEIGDLENARATIKEAKG